MLAHVTVDNVANKYFFFLCVIKLVECFVVACPVFVFDGHHGVAVLVENIVEEHPSYSSVAVHKGMNLDKL